MFLKDLHRVVQIKRTDKEKETRSDLNLLTYKLIEDFDHLGGFFRENPLNADRKNQPKPKKAIKDPILEKLKIWAELLGVKEHQVNYQHLQPKSPTSFVQPKCSNNLLDAICNTNRKVKLD